MIFFILILDLITYQDVLTKGRVFFVDCSKKPMEAVDVLAGSVLVCDGNNVTQFTVLVPESPPVFFALPPEVHVSVEIDSNIFLDSQLLRRGLHEDVVARKVKNDGKYLNINYLFTVRFV